VSVKTFAVPVEPNNSYLYLLVFVDPVNIATVKSVAADNCKLFFANSRKKQHAQPKLPS